MKKIPLSVLALTIVSTFLFFSILESRLFAHDKENHAQKVSKTEITYTEHIKPLFEERCAKCHGEKSPVHMEYIKDIKHYKLKTKGPRMSNYTHMVSFIVWPDTGSLMRALDDGENTENNKPGKMYKNLGKTVAERQKNLKLFKDWVGNWILKEWPDIKKEEINKMKLIY